MLVRGASINVTRHISRAIASALTSPDPWPHTVVEDIFPREFYDELIHNFPLPTEMEPLSRSTTLRQVYWLEKKDDIRPQVTDFWNSVREEVFDALWMALEDKTGVVGRTIGAELTSDVPGYYLGPHTDTPDKLITALFYLPRELGVEDQGTVLYHCDTPDPRGKGHKFGDEFKEVKTVPFARNTMLFFERTDTSFHGVKQTRVARHALAFDIFK